MVRAGSTAVPTGRWSTPWITSRRCRSTARGACWCAFAMSRGCSAQRPHLRDRNASAADPRQHLDCDRVRQGPCQPLSVREPRVRAHRRIVGGRDHRQIHERDLPADQVAELRSSTTSTVVATRETILVEEQVRIGGQTRMLLTNKFPLFDTHGEPYATCGIAADITERKAHRGRVTAGRRSRCRAPRGEASSTSWCDRWRRSSTWSSHSSRCAWQTIQIAFARSCFKGRRIARTGRVRAGSAHPATMWSASRFSL